MRSWALTLLAGVALGGQCRAGLAQAPGGPDSAAVRRWTEDLAFLSREMPERHASLFHAMRREQFDSALSSIRARLPQLARSRVIVELMRLAALVGDGHTNVSPWRDTIVAFHTLPIALYRFEEGYVVRAATLEHADLLGARVLRIGAVPIDSAESLVAPLIGRDNAMGVWMYAPLLLVMPEVLHELGMAPEPGSAEVTFDLNGVTRTVRLAAAGRFPNLSGDADRSWEVRSGWVDLRDRAATPLWLSRARDTYWFTDLPASRLLYCQLNEIQERGEPLEAFLRRALARADSAGAERFVLDLRLNGGGNAFYNRVIVRALVRSRFDAPGRLFVVTGRRTFSAAQMLISDLEKWSNPIFVGEPSSSRGNHYGDSRRLVLPNSGVTVRVSTLRWQYWDPRDTRPWIVPDLAAPLTVEAYRAGRDPALEAVARFAQRPLLVEQTLVDSLAPLLRARDSVAAWTLADGFQREPAHRWSDVSQLVGLVAGELRGEGQPLAAALAERLRGRLGPWAMPR